MTLKETSKEVALGSTIGALTGPIGASGGTLFKGATGLARLGIRTLAGSSAGAVSGAIVETSRAINGEEVTGKSFMKSIGMGALMGAVGGASAQAASSASSKVSNEVTKAITRVGVQGASAAATDAGIQYYQTGEVDLAQTALNTTGQLVVATTAEVSSAAAQRTNAYANKVNNQLVDENVKKDNLTPKEAQEIKDRMKALNNMKGEVKPGGKVGEGNAHVLEDRTNSKRGGQIAVDFGSKSEDGRRGGGRVITENIKGKQIYVDHTTEHDYKGCRETIRGQIQNPIDGLKTVKVGGLTEHVEHCDEEESFIEKEKKE